MDVTCDAQSKQVFSQLLVGLDLMCHGKVMNICYHFSDNLYSS